MKLSAASNIIAIPLASHFSSNSTNGDHNKLMYLYTKRPSQSRQERQDKHKVLKLVIPHVLMLVAVCLYLVVGAGIFYWLEHHPQNSIRDEARFRILQAQSKMLAVNSRNTLREHMHNYTMIVMHETHTTSISFHDLISEQQTNLWSFSDCVLFSFAIITTIGYGNIAPVTIKGRIFCMVYALFGIPVAMLAIANIGRFIAEGLINLMGKIEDTKVWLINQWKKHWGLKNEEVENEGKEAEDAASVYYPHGPISLMCLLVTVGLYLTLGALILPSWESIPFMSALYFMFITITTTGLGDIVPEKMSYLPITLFYIALGVAIMSMAIELAAEYMRKLHYFGRKVKNTRFARVHIGGKTILVQDLVQNLGEQYGVDPKMIESFVNFNLDDFIEGIADKSQHENNVAAAKACVAETATVRKLGPFSIDAPDLRHIDSCKNTPTLTRFSF